MTFLLGKLPPRPDSRTLQLANYLHAETAHSPLSNSSCHPERSEGSRLDSFAAASGQGTALPAKLALPPAPRYVDWTAKIPSWPMFSNDSLADCTAAAAAHMIQCWTANAGDAFMPTSAQVIAAYSATSHYIPGNAATDQGAVELDVLNFWRRQGIAGHKIDAYVSFRPQNFEHTRQAISLFGGIYIGLALPLSAQNQGVWDVPSFLSRIAAFIHARAFYPRRAQRKTPFLISRGHRAPSKGEGRQFPSRSMDEALRGRGFSSLLTRQRPAWALAPEASANGSSTNAGNNFTPGSWGGHAVPILAYDSDTLTCITWGAKKRMTWEFFARYCDESYAPLSPDWLNAHGTDPAGLDLAQLRADLAQLSSAPQNATVDQI